MYKYKINNSYTVYVPNASDTTDFGEVFENPPEPLEWKPGTKVMSHFYGTPSTPIQKQVRCMQLIGRLQEHISSLRQEQEVAKKYEAALLAWRDRAAKTDPTDVELLDKLLVISRKRLACISRKIARTERLCAKFRAAL